MPCSELMIFIGYEDNRYCFMHHTQENIIFYSTHAIFDERLFSKYTDSHTKEYKLYDKLLNKTSPETKLSVSDSSGKNGPALIPIPHTHIPPTPDNLPTCSLSPSLSYKFISLPLTPEFKKPVVNIEENDDINTDVEMQLPSSQ